MDPGSEHSKGSTVEGSREIPASPPSAGLARSIRALFEGPIQASTAPPIRLEESSGEAEAGSATPGDLGVPAKSAVRDRFVTRIASFLRASPDSRGRFVDGILDDTTLLRKEGGFYLVLDAVAALLSAGEGEGLTADGRSLAGEIMDPLLAHYLALRIGLEKESLARAPLIAIAHAFPALSAPAFAAVLAESTDPEASRILREVLLHLGEDGRSAALTLLREPRWFAVRDGVRLVGESRDRDSVQALTVVLAHEDPGVRKETVIALARIGGEDAGLLLVGMLNDPHPGVREVAALGVADLRVLRAMRPLLEMVATEEEEAVLVQVLLALGAMGDPGAVPAIEKKAVVSIFSRPPRQIRVAAYRALAAIGSPHARALVEAAVEDKDIEVRQTVAEILQTPE
jgi:HEAT repeat protein